jgi:hypothetical protein
MGVYLPTNLKEALYLLAHARTEPRNDVTMSGLARDYIKEGLEREGELPEEVADLLDDDLLANAGGDESGEESEA